MDLMERYLGAVRRNLPARDAADIVAELRDVLLARAEEQEEALGRPLREDEWEALLVDFGHPLVVAAQYRPRQWLIGPELYPFYLYFLKLIGALVAFGVTVAAIVQAAVHQGEPGPLIAGYLGSLWGSVTGTIGAITIVFALIERYGGVARHFRTWHPRQLPEIDLAGKEPSRWESAVEIALGLGLLLWWTGTVTLPFRDQSSSFRLDPAPVWAQLWWPILALIVLRLVHNVLRWLAPGWRWVGALLSIATAVGGVTLAALLYPAGRWLVVVPITMAADQAHDIQASLDLSLRIAIVAVAVIWTWQCLQQLWRWMRGAPR